jgi:hypothetical protein
MTSTKLTTLTRRSFLRGAGGATLAIPALPSLLGPAEARAALADDGKLFIPFLQIGSGVWSAKLCPDAAQPDEVKPYAGFAVQRTTLRPEVAGGVTRISEVLQGPSTLLTPRLVAKMNVIRGCDWPKPLAHNHAALGNLGAAFGEDTGDEMRVSVDQLMAWSSGFYRAFEGLYRTVQVGWGPGGVFSYSNPSARTGSIAHRSGDGARTPGKLFDLLFGRFAAPTDPAVARRPVVDLVLESYRRTRANPRLSPLDRVRLDDHVQRIADLQRRLTFALPGGCAMPGRPSADPTDLAALEKDADRLAALYRSFHDLIVAAASCDLSRIFIYTLPYFPVPSGILMHHEVEHHAMERDGIAQARMVESNRRIFRDVMLPLAAKLDAVVDAGGRTLLDRALLLRSTEMGEFDHTTTGQIFVTIGGANGAVRTGNYLDYRNLGQLAVPASTSRVPELQRIHLGLTIQQFWGSILRVMGVPHAQWAERDHGGYGKRVMGKLRFLHCCTPPPPEQFYTDKVWAAAGDVLPWFGA